MAAQCGVHKVYQLVWIYFTQSIPTGVVIFHTKYTNWCGSISHKVYQLVWIYFTQSIPTGVDLFHTKYTNWCGSISHKVHQWYKTECMVAQTGEKLCYTNYTNFM